MVGRAQSGLLAQLSAFHCCPSKQSSGDFSLSQRRFQRFRLFKSRITSAFEVLPAICLFVGGLACRTHVRPNVDQPLSDKRSRTSFRTENRYFHLRA